MMFWILNGTPWWGIDCSSHLTLSTQLGITKLSNSDGATFKILKCIKNSSLQIVKVVTLLHCYYLIILLKIIIFFVLWKNIYKNHCIFRYLMELLDEELSAPATSLYPHNLAGILETAIRYRIVFQNFSQSSQRKCHKITSAKSWAICKSSILEW